MSGSYVQCSNCGKRALNIATRCPQCGHEFPPRPAPVRRSRDGVAVLAIAGVAAAVIALVVVVSERLRETPAEQASAVAVVPPDTATLDTSSRASAETRAEPRFARTWTKVRTRRSTTADVAAVLLPGDTVQVDSLRRGWWRVRLEGNVVGYAHESTLDTNPPGPKVEIEK